MKKISEFQRLISIIFLVFVIVSLLYLLLAWRSNLWPFNNSWQVVALSSGDVYFGHLVWFPTPHLNNVWYVRNIKDKKGGSNPRLFPLTGVFWGPENSLHLQTSKIVWWSNLKENSQVVSLIKSQSQGSANYQASSSHTSSNGPFGNPSSVPAPAK